MQVHPYVSFEGRAEEAAEFYKRAIGAQVTTLMRMKEAPEQPPPGVMPPGYDEKVLHMELRIGDSLVMGTDGSCAGKAVFSGISLTLSGANDAETKRLFDKLSDGGNVQMPLAKTFFASSFGMVTDRFGIMWMVMTETA